jgi:hypothetical protein
MTLRLSPAGLAWGGRWHRHWSALRIEFGLGDTLRSRGAAVASPDACDTLHALGCARQPTARAPRFHDFGAFRCVHETCARQATSSAKMVRLACAERRGTLVDAVPEVAMVTRRSAVSADAHDTAIV